LRAARENVTDAAIAIMKRGKRGTLVCYNGLK
jgi:hypothetical protein